MGRRGIAPCVLIFVSMYRRVVKFTIRSALPPGKIHRYPMDRRNGLTQSPRWQEKTRCFFRESNPEYQSSTAFINSALNVKDLLHIQQTKYYVCIYWHKVCILLKKTCGLNVTSISSLYFAQILTSLIDLACHSLAAV